MARPETLDMLDDAAGHLLRIAKREKRTRKPVGTDEMTTMENATPLACSPLVKNQIDDLVIAHVVLIRAILAGEHDDFANAFHVGEAFYDSHPYQKPEFKQYPEYQLGAFLAKHLFNADTLPSEAAFNTAMDMVFHGSPPIGLAIVENLPIDTINRLSVRGYLLASVNSFVACLMAYLDAQPAERKPVRKRPVRARKKR